MKRNDILKKGKNQGFKIFMYKLNLNAKILNFFFSFVKLLQVYFIKRLIMTF